MRRRDLALMVHPITGVHYESDVKLLQVPGRSITMMLEVV